MIKFLSVNVPSPSKMASLRKRPVVVTAPRKPCLVSHERKSVIKKTVSFEDRTTLYKVPYLFEPEDIDIHFYGPDDFQCFRLRDKHIVEAIKSEVSAVLLEAHLGECTRGLEREHPEMKKRSSTQRREAFSLVLSLQDCRTDQEAIAVAYGRASRCACRDASIMGRLDAKSVQVSELAGEGGMTSSSTNGTVLRNMKIPGAGNSKTSALSRPSHSTSTWQTNETKLVARTA
jgi:hypothetical protein